MATELGDSIVAIITGGGIGAGVAAIATAVIQSRSGKSEARAHAADMLAEASGTLSTHYVNEIARLTERTTAMRLALAELTEQVDTLLEDPAIKLTGDQARSLRRANQAAKATS